VILLIFWLIADETEYKTACIEIWVALYYK